jgi:pimeloyl-ACP methyl ester carboxylesterase
MTKHVVFIHGNFVSRHCWDAWIPRYEARGYTCIAPAYPGREGSVASLKLNQNDPLLGTLTIEQTVEHLANAIRALPEKPIIIGHSFGGLLTQLMVQRDLGVAAVAIDSVPPPGVVTLKWSFLRSLWPVVNPFVSASKPYYMPFSHFQYTFVNDLPLSEQRKAYDADVVPESRRLGRGGLSSFARVDFKKPHAPLLMIAGERDHIMPASLNRSNFNRYRKGNPSSSPTSESSPERRTTRSSAATPAGKRSPTTRSIGWRVASALSPLQHGQRPERMPAKPSGGELHQPPMEAGIGKGLPHARDIRVRQAAFHEAERDIDEIAPAKRVDKRIAMRPDSMMQIDHRLDVRTPLCETVRLQIFTRQGEGRREVVERTAAPDAEVVKAGGNDDLVAITRVVVQRLAEVNDARDVIAIRLRIGAQRVVPARENLVGERDRFDLHAPRMDSRETNRIPRWW